MRANAMEPGWVATKMSPRATGDLDAAHRTQVWLAVGDEPSVGTGGYYYHLHPRSPSGGTAEPTRQDRLLAACERLSGVSLPD